MPSNPQITYNYFRNPQQREQAEAAVNAALPYLPWWVQYISVDSQADGGENVNARVNLSPEYRNITISVFKRNEGLVVSKRSLR